MMNRNPLLIMLYVKTQQYFVNVIQIFNTVYL